jgi:hypothetical protein
MGGAAQVAMRVASQIWQVVFASQTLQVVCLALRKKAQYVVVRAHLTCLAVFQFNHANYITTNKQVTITLDVVFLEGVVNLRFFVA